LEQGELGARAPALSFWIGWAILPSQSGACELLFSDDEEVNNGGNWNTAELGACGRGASIAD